MIDDIFHMSKRQKHTFIDDDSELNLCWLLGLWDIYMSGFMRVIDLWSHHIMSHTTFDLWRQHLTTF